MKSILLAILVSGVFSQFMFLPPQGSGSKADNFPHVDSSWHVMPLVEDEEAYSFGNRVQMKMTTTEKKKETVVTCELLFSDTKPLMGLHNIQLNGQAQEGLGTVIMDSEASRIVTLINSNGSKIAMSMKMDPSAFYSTEEETETTNISKTGRTKEILGYTCSEYEFSDGEVNGTCWITEELHVNMANAFAMLGQGKNKTAEGYPPGFFLEMNSVSKNGKASVHMIVTEIDLNANVSISTEGYQKMGF